MFIETRTDENVMIATSHFLRKKKPVRVEMFQKSATDMLILQFSASSQNKQDFSSDFLIYNCYFWWKS